MGVKRFSMSKLIDRERTALLMELKDAHVKLFYDDEYEHLRKEYGRKIRGTYSIPVVAYIDCLTEIMGIDEEVFVTKITCTDYNIPSTMFENFTLDTQKYNHKGDLLSKLQFAQFIGYYYTNNIKYDQSYNEPIYVAINPGRYVQISVQKPSSNMVEVYTDDAIDEEELEFDDMMLCIDGGMNLSMAFSKDLDNGTIQFSEYIINNDSLAIVCTIDDSEYKDYYGESLIIFSIPNDKDKIRVLTSLSLGGIADEAILPIKKKYADNEFKLRTLNDPNYILGFIDEINETIENCFDPDMMTTAGRIGKLVHFSSIIDNICENQYNGNMHRVDRLLDNFANDTVKAIYVDDSIYLDQNVLDAACQLSSIVDIQSAIIDIIKERNLTFRMYTTPTKCVYWFGDTDDSNLGFIDYNGYKLEREISDINEFTIAVSKSPISYLYQFHIILHCEDHDPPIHIISMPQRLGYHVLFETDIEQVNKSITIMQDSDNIPIYINE